MARPVILGNSGLTVGLNEQGLVHDFYYPYVGLENLTTSRMQPHNVGIWIDGDFSWLGDNKWEMHVDFEETALVSNITAVHKKTGIFLLFQDFVDCNFDVFARKIKVVNKTEKETDFRLFFHQVFQISALGRADTAMYVPDGHYMLDYKGRCTILAYAEVENGEPFDQYAAGNAGIEGKEGTFRDSEDGELSMSAVEHGGVDSTIRVAMVVGARETKYVHYWLAIADTQQRLEILHDQMLGDGFNKRMHATYQHWHEWLSQVEETCDNLEIRYATALRKSMMVIKAHTDEHGGIIASCDSSIYNYGRDYYSYVWPRDGAFVMWPLIKLGYKNEPKAFFEFCRSIMHPDGYLMHKYQPDRAIGSTWHPLVHGKRRELAIQEDETAIVVFMLSEYLKYSNDRVYVNSMYESFIKPACDFMVEFIDEETALPHASYDLWEEKFLSNTYTTAVTYRALVEGATIAERNNNLADSRSWGAAAKNLKQNANKYFDEDKAILIKGFLVTEDQKIIDKTLDVSSLYGAWMFDFSPKQHVAHTAARIEELLLDKSPSGGSPRYEHDSYFRSDPAHMGNPWFVTTLWMAQFYASIGKTDETKLLVDWTLGHALPSGVLSEQVNPETGAVVGVTPLVWSHAELINTLLVTNN
jgi:GH15 family glucan-1,4-alpha-glucosidase